MEPAPRSRVHRLLEAVGLVAIWMALGWALRLEPNAYLLLGIPLTVAFQLFVRRRPLRALWVRSAPPLSRHPILIVLAAGLAAFPLYRVATLSASNTPWSIRVWYFSAIAGSLGAAYALYHFHRSTLRPLLLCLATAGTLGILLVLLTQSTRGPLWGIPSLSLPVALTWLLLYFPVAFVLEEVTFRGALDAHVQDPGEPHAFGSALFVAALWGLWHLPIVAAEPDLFLPVQALVLVVVHSIVGVPLAWWWRRSGNLAVPAFTHAAIDAVRNALLS